MRVARLELTGIGPFEGAVFTIPEPTGGGELVLFEGPNGCGKTTIVQAIAMAAASASLRSQPSYNVFACPDDQLTRRIRADSGCATVLLARGDEAMEVIRTRGMCRWQGASTGGVQSYLTQFFGAARQTGATPWAAFAFRGHATTAQLETEGPREISKSALQGSLSFGGADPPASRDLGQILLNLEFERIQSKLYVAERSDGDERQRFNAAIASRERSLARFKHALSEVLARRVDTEFALGAHAPRILFDGEEIPFDLLGEGMRNTVSWLSDLYVRLERTSWASPEVSPFDQDFWLILDEIEESLHPTMQAHIYPALRELFPNAHIYATTHSPFVVASVGEGVAFPIRPDKDHRVRGEVAARALQPGQSLELVTTDIFQAPAGFVDQQTRDDLDAHDRDVQTLQRKKEVDWTAFLARRDRLMALNDEVRTIVAMQEVPVQKEVLHRLRERIADQERGARP